VVGKSGVEYYYEELLSGEAGWNEYDVDAYGRIVPEGARVDSYGQFVDESGKPIEINASQELPDHVKPSEPGNNLTLTVDLDLQRVVEKELDAAIERTREEGYAGRGGAVVAMDPRNGEVLALASRPDFDPQLFVGGISGSEELRTFEYLTSKRSGDPFTNRAIVGGQPGASTFKIFTGLAGMAAGVIDAYTIVDDKAAMNSEGCWTPSSTSVSPCYRSWRQNSPNYEYLGDHGPQNFTQAIADSNDIFFYQVADWIWNQTGDKDWLPKYYEKWGFGELTGIDISGETEGRIPTEQGEKELYEALHGTSEGAYWSVGDWDQPLHRPGGPAGLPDPDGPRVLSLYNGGTSSPRTSAWRSRTRAARWSRRSRPSQRAGWRDPGPDRHVVAGFRGVTAKKGHRGDDLQGFGYSHHRQERHGRAPDGDFVNWFAGWTEGRSSPWSS
jgi:penicillin-binding protein 2